MPLRVEPIVAAGRMRDAAQPGLSLEQGLLLRPWQPEDAPAVLAAFSDPDIRFWHMRAMETPDDALAWIATWAPRWIAETDAGWAIADAASGEVCGQVALRTISLWFGTAEISYWVLPAHRGRGIAVRAASGLARWCFEDLKMHRLAIEHSVANEASCRVALKAGFAVEGTMRGALLQEDGWHDAHLHARIEPEA